MLSIMFIGFPGTWVSCWQGHFIVNAGYLRWRLENTGGNSNFPIQRLPTWYWWWRGWVSAYCKLTVICLWYNPLVVSQLFHKARHWAMSYETSSLPWQNIQRRRHGKPFTVPLEVCLFVVHKMKTTETGHLKKICLKTSDNVIKSEKRY